MNKEFIPYEPSQDLKELGFDEECLAFYNSTLKTPNELLYPQYGGEVGNWNVENHLISAPLYQQAFRWFREKHNLFANIHSTRSWVNSYKIVRWNTFGDYDTIWDGEKNFRREEAELVCLIHLIQIVKNEKQ